MFDFPLLTSPTNVITSVNRLITSLIAYLRNIPGSALRKGSVANDRLAKGGAESFPVFYLGTCAAANRANIAKHTILTSDGGAVTRKNIAFTLWCDAAATINAGDAINLYVGATYGTVGPAVGTISLNQANLAANEPISGTLSFDLPSGQNLYASYAWGGIAGSSYPNVHLMLQQEAPHVTTG